MFCCQSPLYLANEEETMQGLKSFNKKEGEGRHSLLLESSTIHVKRAKGVNSGADILHRPQPKHSGASTFLAKHSFFITGPLIQLCLQLLFASLIFF
ncbi:hypothetical protein FRX31_017389 [Thalictrum thalictroides]|uniref:Uncharacterized protein n=1 Tax=Thalictrum thalictroides TaxID=46969 RepID=A0A7J6W6J9_THATH|nr:hypothetical protein FRX31_017389 [Thalictrum thalictroides]